MTEPINLKQHNHSHHQRQPSVGATAAAITSKINKKGSILESIYLSFGYKPPNKEELYQLVCKYTISLSYLILIYLFCCM